MNVRRRRRSRIDLGRPWRDADYLVVDLETTGLNLRRDAIASYGAVIIHDGRIVTACNTYRLVRPTRAMSPESVTVHALRPADVADAPPLAEAVETLDGLLTDRILVAHAAWIEQSFLSRAFRKCGKKLRCNIIDTAAMARKANAAVADCRGEPNLEQLAEELGLPVVSPHHALGDAITTAQVFLALASRLAQRGYSTARDFVDLTAGDGLLRR